MRINSIPGYNYGHLGMAQKQKSAQNNVSFGMFYAYNPRTEEASWAASRAEYAFRRAYGNMPPDVFSREYEKDDLCADDYLNDPEMLPWCRLSKRSKDIGFTAPLLDVVKSLSIYVTISPYLSMRDNLFHKSELGRKVITVKFNEDGLEPMLSPERREEALRVAKELGFKKDPKTGKYNEIKFLARDLRNVRRLQYMAKSMYPYEIIETAGTKYPGLDANC